VRDSVETIFESRDFGYEKEVTGYRLKDDSKDKVRQDIDRASADWLVDFLIKLADFAKYFMYFAGALIVTLVVLALLKYLPDSWKPQRRRPTLELLDEEHHPLTRSLPDDIGAAARSALDKGDQRGATSLLYRGALRTVMRRHNLSIPRSATERECRHLVIDLGNNEQSNDFARIVNEWIGIAYADQHSTDVETESLIQFFEDNFTDDSLVQSGSGVARDLPSSAASS